MEKKIEGNKVLEKREKHAEEIKLKRKEIRRKNFLKVTLKFFLFVVFVSIPIYLLFYSPFFVIKEIRISRLNYIQPEILEQEFEFLKGQNFFLSDLSLIREEMVEEYVFVSEIYTEKVFPSTIVVRVVENEPFLLINSVEYGCSLIDKSGYVLSEDYLTCTDLKEIYSVKELVGSDIDYMDFEYGLRSNLYSVNKIHDVVSVLNYYSYGIRKMELEEQVLKVELYSDNYLIFSMVDDLDIQLKRLIVLTNEIQDPKISFLSLDLRFERPVLIEK